MSEQGTNEYRLKVRAQIVAIPQSQSFLEFYRLKFPTVF